MRRLAGPDDSRGFLGAALWEQHLPAAGSVGGTQREAARQRVGGRGDGLREGEATPSDKRAGGQARDEERQAVMEQPGRACLVNAWPGVGRGWAGRCRCGNLPPCPPFISQSRRSSSSAGLWWTARPTSPIDSLTVSDYSPKSETEVHPRPQKIYTGHRTRSRSSRPAAHCPHRRARTEPAHLHGPSDSSNISSCRRLSSGSSSAHSPQSAPRSRAVWPCDALQRCSTPTIVEPEFCSTMLCLLARGIPCRCRCR